MKDVPIFPFWEELDQIIGKTIVALYGGENWDNRLLLVFSDKTAALVTEDTSGCWYPGEHGGMMLTEPDNSDRQKAQELWDATAARQSASSSPEPPSGHAN